MLSRRYQLKLPSGTVYHVALVRTDVSEKVSSALSGVLKARLFSTYFELRTPNKAHKPLTLNLRDL
jgi:hypothetical protein